MTGDNTICQTLEILLLQLRKWSFGCNGCESIVTVEEKNASNSIALLWPKLMSSAKFLQYKILITVSLDVIVVCSSMWY